MATWLWIVIVVAAALVVAAVAYAARRQSRTASLKSTFGPEYDRLASMQPRREAEAELVERRRRRESLDIRALAGASRDRYLLRWDEVQARFVDDPEGAVGDADVLIQQVMAERGFFGRYEEPPSDRVRGTEGGQGTRRFAYPVEEFEQRAADVSVEHPDVVEHYRQGHTIATSMGFGAARTEELRQAMHHYRALFDELLVAERVHEEAHR